jgi:L-alanine-DL-glutamate epimerase-like enolase superfamily enzyme
VQITAIRLDRMRLELDPPFAAAWDPVPRRHFDATLVRVETDSGITGYGSGDTMDGFEPFAGLFTGTDPLNIADQVRRLESVSFHAGRYWPLEAALWDILGKKTGVPAATLLGGARTRLPAYASFGAALPPPERAEAALAARAAGFRALKIRIPRTGPRGPGPASTDLDGTGPDWGPAVAQGIQAVRAVREAVGPDMAIMCDLNQWWRMAGDLSPALDARQVRRIAGELADLGVTWLEEPLPGGDTGDLDGMRELRQVIRVAGGEMARTPGELLSALDAGALDVLQPDVVLSVGLLRTRMIAELALLRGRWFTPHTWTNGLGLLANLHVVCGVGGGPYVEYPWDPPGWTPERRDFFLREPVTVDADGYLTIPAAPGLGAEVDESAVARYAVSRQELRADLYRRRRLAPRGNAEYRHRQHQVHQHARRQPDDPRVVVQDLQGGDQPGGGERPGGAGRGVGAADREHRADHGGDGGPPVPAARVPVRAVPGVQGRQVQ